MQEHLHPHRGWALIRDDGKFTPDELDHLNQCPQCHGWLTKFTSLAREAGFKITFKIPAGPPKKNSGGGSSNQGSQVA